MGAIKSISAGALKFHVVSAAGAGIYLATTFGLTEIFGVYYLVCAMVGAALATLWNFGLNSFWTWRAKQWVKSARSP